MEYHIEHFKKLQELIETNLEALSQAHYNQEEVRKQIAVIIVSRFKKYLKLTK
jgi:20S proteasome alpha/beta subunit